MAKNFPNLINNINLHIQESWNTPSRINKKRSTPKHIIVNLSEDKEKILKGATERENDKQTHHVQGIFNESNNWLTRNQESQDAVRW